MRVQREATIRRKKNEAAFRKLRNKQAAVSGRKPLRDREYMAWIRTLPCLIADCIATHWAGAACSKIEAAHSGPHGISQKANDFSCLPMCAWHHRLGPHSYHSLGPKFFEYHGMKSREVLISAYNLAYKEGE